MYRVASKAPRSQQVGLWVYYAPPSLCETDWSNVRWEIQRTAPETAQASSASAFAARRTGLSTLFDIHKLDPMRSAGGGQSIPDPGNYIDTFVIGDVLFAD